MDATLNFPLGLRSSALLARALVERPFIRPIVLALKSYLLLHGLHQPYGGGVSGFLLANMVHWALMQPPPRSQRAGDYDDDDDEFDDAEGKGGGGGGGGDGGGRGGVARGGAPEDLGGAFLRTLWLYGFELDLSNTLLMGGAVQGGSIQGGSVLGASVPAPGTLALPGSPGWLPHEPKMLSLSPPLGESDLGAKAHRFSSVRLLIRGAYTRMMRELSGGLPSRKGRRNAAERHRVSGGWGGEAWGEGSICDADMSEEASDTNEEFREEACELAYEEVGESGAKESSVAADSGLDDADIAQIAAARSRRAELRRERRDEALPLSLLLPQWQMQASAMAVRRMHQQWVQMMRGRQKREAQPKADGQSEDAGLSLMAADGPRWDNKHDPVWGVDSKEASHTIALEERSVSVYTYS